MQMYDVRFQTHYPDGIDAGRCIVCAANNDLASDMVALHLDLPPSSTRFTTTRVKPSIFQAERHEIVRAPEDLRRKPRPGESAGPGSGTSGPSVETWLISVTARVRAMAQGGALRKLAAAVVDRASYSRTPDDRSIHELEISCERKEYVVRTAAIEKQAIYKARQIFQGGSARGKG